jgi:hypothetical protein
MSRCATVLAKRPKIFPDASSSIDSLGEAGEEGLRFFMRVRGDFEEHHRCSVTNPSRKLHLVHRHSSFLFLKRQQPFRELVVAASEGEEPSAGLEVGVPCIA